MRNGTHRRNGGRIVKLGKSEEGKFVRRQNYEIKIESEKKRIARLNTIALYV